MDAVAEQPQVETPRRVKCLTVDEFRAALGNLPRATFYRMLAGRKLPKPTIQIGRRKLWRQSSVEEFLDQKEGRR